jgi:hypothetical protein
MMHAALADRLEGCTSLKIRCLASLLVCYPRRPFGDV